MCIVQIPCKKLEINMYQKPTEMPDNRHDVTKW